MQAGPGATREGLGALGGGFSASISWELAEVKQLPKSLVAGNAAACWSRHGLPGRPLWLPAEAAAPRPQGRHIAGVLSPPNAAKSPNLAMLQNDPQLPEGRRDHRELCAPLGLILGGGQQCWSPSLGPSPLPRVPAGPAAPPAPPARAAGLRGAGIWKGSALLTAAGKGEGYK